MLIICNMQIRSWHLASGGFVFFCFYLISNYIADNIRCQQVNCHDEFGSVAVFLMVILTVIFIFPAVLLWIKKDIKKSTISIWWIIVALCLGLRFNFEMLLLALIGWIGLCLFNHWWQALGAVLSILIGIEIAAAVILSPYGQVVMPTSWDITSIFLLISAFFYISAGILFEAKENKKREIVIAKK